LDDTAEVGSIPIGQAPLFLIPELRETAKRIGLNQGPFKSQWEYYATALIGWGLMLLESADPRAVKVGEFCSTYVEEVLQKRMEENDDEGTRKEKESESKGRKKEGEFVLVHGDFGTNNIMADHSGRVTAVIDWEGAFAGPIDQDLCAIRKVAFSAPKKKNGEEGYEEEAALAELFRNKVVESGGQIKPDESVKECSWLARLAQSLIRKY